MTLQEMIQQRSERRNRLNLANYTSFITEISATQLEIALKMLKKYDLWKEYNSRLKLAVNEIESRYLSDNN